MRIHSGDTVMPLTNTAIRNIKPQETPFKMSDEKGLYLLVKKSGKYFRFDYRFEGKRKTMALGVYPDVTLKEARDKRDDARKLLENGVEPMAHAKILKEQEQDDATNSFEAVALEWFSRNKHSWAKSHSRTVIRRMERDLFPWIGREQISSLTAPVILDTLRRIETRGAIETAHRVKQICGQVFRYAIATGRAERDPSADLKGALRPVRHKHMATITDPKGVSELLRAIEGYQGHFVTRCALRFAPLVFVRPGELRKAEWKEFDTEKGEWRIPAEKMKVRQPHTVPLSKQAIAILKELYPLTGGGTYLFPSIRSRHKPMSDNTILLALRRLDYAKEEMSGHGFRSMASTLLHELGWRSDLIERQLAHTEKDTVKVAYNHAQYLPERRKMMQAWADYLDKLRDIEGDGGNG